MMLGAETTLKVLEGVFTGLLSEVAREFRTTLYYGDPEGMVRDPKKELVIIVPKSEGRRRYGVI